jgi:hypothetical protein
VPQRDHSNGADTARGSLASEDHHLEVGAAARDRRSIRRAGRPHGLVPPDDRSRGSALDASSSPPLASEDVFVGREAA